MLPVSNPSDLQVLYDSEPIPMTDDYSDVLDPTDDNMPEYLAILGKEATQILVSIPKFSAHEIVIAKKAVPRKSGTSWALISGITVAMASLILAWIILRRK